MPDPYDALTIAALVAELSATIGNGRVQRLGLIDARTLGAEIYAGGQRHYLLASADDRRPRLRLASAMPSLDPALVTPFGLLLRKHVRGGVILGIDQPPLERLARFSIAKRQAPRNSDDAALPGWAADDDDDEEPLPEENAADVRFFTLVVELMGRHSNLILVDDEGRIMESAKRVTPAMSRVRTVLPRLPYAPPPPLDRHDPRAATGDELAPMLASAAADSELSRVLIATYRGVSPTIAREVVFRVLGDAEARVGDVGSIDVEALAKALRAIVAPLRTGNWAPRVYQEREGEGAVVAVSPIGLAHLAARYDDIAVASISEALALAENREAGGSAAPIRHAQRRARLLAAVGAARERADRRLAALAEQAVRAEEAERWKRWGESIYANLWQIAPGQTTLESEGERIPLDPDRSPSENAQGYFERYRKGQGAAAQLPALAGESQTEIAYLDQLATLIAQAPGFAELEALAAEWNEGRDEEEGARPKAKRKSAPKRPQPLLDAAGNAVYVGRSGPQNDLLTFDLAGPDDTWLHARGVGGSHVIIRWRTPDATEDEATISAAAALAAWYSAARESGAVEVDVARRRHVRKIKGARPGMVTYRNERTVRVQPLAEEGVKGVLGER